MKTTTFVLLVSLALVAVEGSPAKKTVGPKCDLVCTADYTPVCGGVPGDKSVKAKLFSNECVMQRYNCESKSNLVKINADECKNAGGIRLF